LSRKKDPLVKRNCWPWLSATGVCSVSASMLEVVMTIRLRETGQTTGRLVLAALIECPLHTVGDESQHFLVSLLLGGAVIIRNLHVSH